MLVKLRPWTIATGTSTHTHTRSALHEKYDTTTTFCVVYGKKRKRKWKKNETKSNEMRECGESENEYVHLLFFISHPLLWMCIENDSVSAFQHSSNVYLSVRIGHIILRINFCIFLWCEQTCARCIHTIEYVCILYIVPGALLCWCTDE